MSDDWRVALDLEEEGVRAALLEDLREYQAAREARQRFGDRIVVTADGPRMYAYAETEEQAREAERVLTESLDRHGVAVTSQIQRWDAGQERWETPSGMPVTPPPRGAGGDRDAPEWEVRVELESHGDTVELADRLEGEGLHVVRRWRYLLLGAETEEQARALAERIRAEAPAGTVVTPEGNEARAWDALHPFAFLGGLAN